MSAFQHCKRNREGMWHEEVGHLYTTECSGFIIYIHVFQVFHLPQVCAYEVIYLIAIRDRGNVLAG